jgi:uncharacterized protein YdaL
MILFSYQNHAHLHVSSKSKLLFYVILIVNKINAALVKSNADECSLEASRGVTDAANLSAGVVKAPEDDILLGQSWKLVNCN